MSFIKVLDGGNEKKEHFINLDRVSHIRAVQVENRQYTAVTFGKDHRVLFDVSVKDIEAAILNLGMMLRKD